MTRFARTSQKTQKTAHAGTSWSQLSQSRSDTSLHGTKSHSNIKAKNKCKSLQPDNGERQSPGATGEYKKFKNQKSEYIKGKVQTFKADLQDITKEQESELAEIYKRDFRREERRLKRVDHRENDKICFNCLQPGHDMRLCPKIKSDREHGTGICFKCASTEHSMHQCPARMPRGLIGKYGFAKCFICKETGHLSIQCPDNPRGLYPNGGGCKDCGSVEHFRKDCRELQKKRGTAEVAVSSLGRDHIQSADVEESLLRKPKPRKPAGPKVVKL